MAGWTESLHPRAPKGKTGGGRFASAPGGGAPAKTAGRSGKVTGRPGPMARAQAHQNAAQKLRGQMRLLGAQIRAAQKAAAASVTQTAHMGPLPVGPVKGSVSGGGIAGSSVSMTIPKPKKGKAAKSTTGLPIVTGTTTSVTPSNTITPAPVVAGSPAASLPVMRQQMAALQQQHAMHMNRAQAFQRLAASRRPVHFAGEQPGSKVIELVGPKGYIHGWIHVGAPGVGGRVHHPSLGHGTVTSHDGKSVTVKFDKGAEHSFEARTGKGGGHLEPKIESWGGVPKTAAGTPDKAAADAIGGALGSGKLNGHVTADERKTLTEAKDAFSKGDHATAADKLAQVHNSLAARNGHESVSAWNDRLFRHANERRSNQGGVTYYQGRDSGQYQREVRDKAADDRFARKQQREAATQARVQARAVEKERNRKPSAAGRRAVERMHAMEAHGKQHRELTRAGFAPGSGGTDWKASSGVSGRYFESRKFNGSDLQISASLNGTYRVRVNGKYVGYARTPEAARSLAQKKALGVAAANDGPAIELGGPMKTPARNDSEVLEMAMPGKMPMIRGAADVQMSRVSPGAVNVMHKSTGIKVGTLASKGASWTGVHAAGKMTAPSASMPGALSALIAMHNAMADKKADAGQAPKVKAMANDSAPAQIAWTKDYIQRTYGDGKPVDLAGSLPYTSAATSSDGPRVTAMGGAGKAKAMAPAKLSSGLSAGAVMVYKKLRRRGMGHGQALALAKRAGAMKAKAA